MHKLQIVLDYLPLKDCLNYIDSPYREACFKLLDEHKDLFENTYGSTHNHQTWPGGYIDHITDGMNYSRHLYALDSSLGRPLNFTLSDALLIFYLHDLEKPWRIMVDENNHRYNKPGLETKESFKQFREQKLNEYGIYLTPSLLNGLTYVEGEGKDYSSTHRVMNELAAFCHKVDVWSARQCYDYPKQDSDEWSGAGRFRV